MKYWIRLYIIYFHIPRRQVKPVTFSQLKYGKAGFQYAALVGERVEDVGECAQIFDQCPFDRVAIMEAFNATL